MLIQSYGWLSEMQTFLLVMAMIAMLLVMVTLCMWVQPHGTHCRTDGPIVHWDFNQLHSNSDQDVMMLSANFSHIHIKHYAMMCLISCDTFWTTDRISITFKPLSYIISVKFKFGKPTHNIDEALVLMSFGVKYFACKKQGCSKVENETRSRMSKSWKWRVCWVKSWV